MTLILNNAEITSLLPMADCLARLDDTYRDMGLGVAGERASVKIYQAARVRPLVDKALH
jgi:hypothetical protein